MIQRENIRRTWMVFSVELLIGFAPSSKFIGRIWLELLTVKPTCSCILRSHD